MSDKGMGWWWRCRQWIGGLLFLLAGRIHETYDVWLDDAEPRHPKP